MWVRRRSIAGAGRQDGATAVALLGADCQPGADLASKERNNVAK